MFLSPKCARTWGDALTAGFATVHAPCQVAFLIRGLSMPDIQLPFSRAEYDERLARTRTAMAKAGVELLLVSDPSNMAWLTGYDGWSFYVHQGVLLALEGEPVWWGRGMDGQGAKRTVFMQPDNIVGYPDHFV